MGATTTPNNKIQIYPCERILERAHNRLSSDKGISECDKADIVRFVEHLQARNISKLRAAKYIYQLIVLARTASKPLEQLRKEDVERLVAHINLLSTQTKQSTTTR